VAINTLETGSFSPEEYKLIEHEHLQLRNSLKSLRDTCRNLYNQISCQSCAREQIATCKGRLVSSFYNIINIATNHSNHEDSIMRRLSPITREFEVLRRHERAHNNILSELNAKVSQCALLDAQGETSEAYRQLYKMMSELLEALIPILS